MIKQIGRYEIVATLGRGGFGHVVSAFDPTFNRMVAIKLLTMTADRSALTRFRNEAIASGRLHHPNIVTVHDSGEQDGTPYIVMELIEGQDLQKIIAARTPLDPWQRIQIIADAASGLAHAHAQGIIHRDIKPANIMMLPDGTVKIMDFGIARMSQSDQTAQTATGSVIGTFNYMAPEQYRGREPSIRSDIFALGLVAYELWTGVHPFYASEQAALLYNVLNVEPAPVHDLWSACPPALEGVLSRMLDKEPDFRYQTLEDALFDIQPALQDLRRGKASELLEGARAARESQLLTVAQQLVRQALDFDPNLSGARDLREMIQSELRRQAVRPRIEDAVREGRERMSAGQLQAAVERFESAVRLDPKDGELQDLLSQARTALNLSRKVSEMMAQAQKSFRAGDLADARRKALAVLALSPTETGAHRLIDRAEAAIEEQRVQELLGRHLARASELIEAAAWAEADDYLRQAQAELPASVELRNLAEKARGGKEKAERNERLASRLAAARSYFDAQEWEESIRELDSIAREFPESTDAANLSRQARVELEREQRDRAVALSLAKVDELAAAERYSEARKTIESALATYPGEQRLHQEMRRLVAAELEGERRAALAVALKSARNSFGRGLLDEADKALNEFTERFGVDAESAGLTGEIARERERQSHLRDLNEAVAHAQKLVDEGRFADAIAHLQDRPALAAEPEARAVVGAAEDHLREIAAREEAYRTAYAGAFALYEQGKLEPALDALDALDRTQEVRPESGALRERIVAEREQLRAAELQTTLAQASELLRDGKAQEAMAVLQGCPAHLRDNPEMARLIKSAEALLHEQRVRERACRQACEKAERLLEKQEWNKALLALEEYQRAFGEDPRLTPLRARAEEALIAQAEADLQELGGMISEHIEAGRFPLAEATLGSLRPADRARPQFASLADELRRRQQTRLITETVEQCERDVERFSEEHNWDEAESCIDRALAACPGHATLIDLQARVREQQEAERREAARGEFVTRIESHIRNGDWDGATGLLKVALQDFPQDDQLTVQWSAVESNRRVREEQEREIAAALEQAERQLPHSPAEALSILEKLDQRYPERTGISRSMTAARNAVRQQQVRVEIAEAERLATKGDFTAALARLDQSQWRGSELEAARRDLLRRQESAREQQFAGELAAAGARLADAPEIARGLLLELQARYPGRAEIASALRDCERQIAGREAAALENEFAQGLTLAQTRIMESPEQAREMLTALEIRFPARQEVASALRDSEKRIADRAAAALEQELAQGLSGAEARMAEAPEQALEMLRALQTRFPRRKEVSSALRSCEKEIAKRAAAAVPADPGSGSPIAKPIFAGAALAVAAVAIWALWPSGPRPAVEQTATQPTAPVETPRPTVPPATAPNTPINTKGTAPKDIAPPTVPPGPQQGQLAIDTGAPNVEVFVDGRSAGRTGIAGVLTLNVAASRHIVEIRDPRFRAVRQEVRIVGGRSAPLNVASSIIQPDKKQIIPPPSRPNKPTDNAIPIDELPDLQTTNRQPGPIPAQINVPQPTAPSPKPPAPTPAPALSSADTAEIRSVLLALGQSVRQKDVAQIERLWPGNPRTAKWANLFKDRDFSVDLSIEPLAEPVLDGQRVTVRAKITEVTRARFARPDSNVRTGNVELIKNGTRWVVSSLP